MAKRARELCAKYVPDKIINESQAQQLNSSISANALIGKDKSVVIVRNNSKLSKQDWRRMLFHEFTHIYCAKIEMDEDNHFIEIYGSGTTSDNPNMTRDEKVYDGVLSSGYVVWSEFIAQYYALKHTKKRIYTVAMISDYINGLIADVNLISGDAAKDSLAMACAYLLNCSDAEKTVAMLKEPDEDMQQAQRSFLDCLFLLHRQINKDRSWRINEDFIVEIGNAYISLKAFNSIDIS